MNRRQMVVLPVIALAARRGFSQTQQTVNPPTDTGTLSRKALAHFSRLKSFYTIPGSAEKQAKYVAFLTNLLSLTPGQQTQATTIYANASTQNGTLKASMKSARRSLGAAVKNLDGAAIVQAANSVGTVAGQRHAVGANANAAFYQILTGDQQTQLNQFRR